MNIIDTHQHLIDPSLSRYSWAEGVPQLAGRSFLYEDYLREIRGTGITGTVFMETSPDEWSLEHGRIVELAAHPGSLIRGIVANARPEEKGFGRWIETIRGGQLSGIRRICHVEPDDFSARPAFVENVRSLGPLDLSFDLCFLARQLPFALALVRACPGVRFILDHCGVPDIQGEGLDPWRVRIRELAAEQNVACKVSGLVAHCAPGADLAATVRPYVLHVIESFGWDRVVWGGDWPVCTLGSTLSRWVEISRELVGDCTHEEQSKLFHRNAASIYRLVIE
jgi:predicted TIM-barrel fold metal-dependent hydrolase